MHSNSLEQLVHSFEKNMYVRSDIEWTALGHRNCILI